MMTSDALFGGGAEPIPTPEGISEIDRILVDKGNITLEEARAMTLDEKLKVIRELLS